MYTPQPIDTTDVVLPLLVVVVAVDPLQSEALGMSLALLLANLVFLAWEDIGIVIENGGAQTVCKHPLNNGRRTRGAAGVEKEPHPCPLPRREGKPTPIPSLKGRE